MTPAVAAGPKPRAAAVIVQWGETAPLERLLDAWPDDSRWHLVVVDNGHAANAPDDPDPLADLAARRGDLDLVRARPGEPANAGFGGGVQRGLRHVLAEHGDALEAILVLNPDARPLAGALDALLDALDGHPDAAGIVPALVDATSGDSQHRWQLQPLPSPTTLLAQVFFLAGRRGPRRPPPAGTSIEQPAAAALLLRPRILVEHPFDRRFHPAWFEDVDLCRRLADAGERMVYAPTARCAHEGGASVPSLGYGVFLWIYLRNLCRYLAKHHGRGWALAARCAVPLAMSLRLAALPLRRPRRAPSRRIAAHGLLQVLAGGLSGWRLPRSLAARFADPAL
ncbi:MAG: glycosyltransferase [Acidobacteriota bacterium]